MGMFGYFKIPDVILTLASSQKLNWTHYFDTHCITWMTQDKILLWLHLIVLLDLKRCEIIALN